MTFDRFLLNHCIPETFFSLKLHYILYYVVCFVWVNSIFSNDSHLFTKLSTCVKSLSCLFNDVHSDTTLCCIYFLEQFHRKRHSDRKNLNKTHRYKRYRYIHFLYEFSSIKFITWLRIFSGLFLFSVSVFFFQLWRKSPWHTSITSRFVRKRLL